MIPVVLLGAGGHAKVIIDILSESSEFEVVGCTSVERGSGEVSGVPILGGDEVLAAQFSAGVRSAFVALGDNRTRHKVFRAVEAMGFRMINAISRCAMVSRRATLGNGVAVMPGAVVMTSSRIGDGVIVNTGATVDHDCSIGPFSHVCPGSHLAGCVTVGEGTLVGTGASAIPGMSIGSWSVIGAGAAVVSDLATQVTAVGVPAAIIKPSKVFS